MGCDYGATISLDPLIAIASSQGIEGNISRLNNHVCYSCGAAQANQYQIKWISLLHSQKKGRKLRLLCHQSSENSRVAPKPTNRVGKCMSNVLLRNLSSYFALCPWASHLTCDCSSGATTELSSCRSCCPVFWRDMQHEDDVWKTNKQTSGGILKSLRLILLHHDYVRSIRCVIILWFRCWSLIGGWTCVTSAFSCSRRTSSLHLFLLLHCFYISLHPKICQTAKRAACFNIIKYSVFVI